MLVAIVISLAVNLALLVIPSVSGVFLATYARPLMTASSDALSSGELLTDRATLVPRKADGLSWLPPRREEREVQFENMYMFVHALVFHPLTSREEREVQF